MPDSGEHRLTPDEVNAIRVERDEERERVKALQTQLAELEEHNLTMRGEGVDLEVALNEARAQLADCERQRKLGEAQSD
jgi:hypothetical protein